MTSADKNLILGLAEELTTAHLQKATAERRLNDAQARLDAELSKHVELKKPNTTQA